MLKILNVNKRYDSKYANKDISLEIENGEIFGFVGPNGAGKSTLIKAIVGIHSMDSGEISLNGLTVLRDPIMYKSLLAYLPDNPDVYDNLSGIAYLNFICDIYKVDSSKRVELIEKYADMFEIKGDLGNVISSYSHGMRQKLMIISAFIHDPKLLVMDEPFVGLDPKSSHILKELMREHVSRGNIIFFSSHVLEVVEKLCSHIAIINNGEIVYDSKRMEGMDESLEEFFLRVTADE